MADPKPSKATIAELEEASTTQRLVPNAPSPGSWEPNVRDLEIYHAYSEGTKSMSQLGREYSLHKTSIWEICHKVEEYLASKYICKIRQLRVRCTERLEMIFANAMQSYHKSLEDAVTITTMTGGESGDITRQEIKGQSGNPAMLAQAREALAEIMRIWGGYAPKVAKIQVTESARVGGRTPEEAAKVRMEHLQRYLKPQTN